MDTEAKLKKIKILALQKEIPLDQVINYLKGVPSKSAAKRKKYSFVSYWIKLARPAYKKKGFSPRQVHIRLAKHPRFHHIIDEVHTKKDKEKFNDKSFKDYKDHNFIKDLPTKGLYARYKLCERLFKDTPLVNKKFLDILLNK